MGFVIACLREHGFITRCVVFPLQHNKKSGKSIPVV
uniref:Uncharacterized protein n=1 Tax=Anguilla anguilla TaxID=7936 RepID=A0A0E9WHU5_ANGAN